MPGEAAQRRGDQLAVGLGLLLDEGGAGGNATVSAVALDRHRAGRAQGRADHRRSPRVTASATAGQIACSCSRSTAPTGAGSASASGSVGDGGDLAAAGRARRRPEWAAAPRRSARAGTAGSAAPPSRASSCSMRNISACSDRSACGWVAFSSASSSWMRGSEPSLTAAIARRQQVDRAQDLALGEALGLRGQAVGVLGGDRERVGHLAQRLHHEQVAQVRGQVAHELGEVAARVGQPLRPPAARPWVVVGQRLGGVEHELGVGHAEDLEHVVELDLACRRR